MRRRRWQSQANRLAICRALLEMALDGHRRHHFCSQNTVMNLLTDIAIDHTYKGKKAPAPITFRMHPFRNTHGDHAGLFEVLRDLKGGAKAKKRSSHLTLEQLAELYARGLPEQYAIRLRLRPSNGTYPDSPPGKAVPLKCVEPDSAFARMVQAVVVSDPISTGLRVQLAILGI